VDPQPKSNLVHLATKSWQSLRSWIGI